jgi:hypothetical protein
MKTLGLLILCFASLAFADDFKTIEGKEYKNAKISRVEPDGIVLITKSGISKVYFTELPKEVQERIHYDPAKAAEFTSQTTKEIDLLRQQRAEEAQKRAQETARYWGERATPAPPSRSASLSNGSRDGYSKAAENPTSEQGLQSCYIEVRNVSSSLEVQRNWETSWGSYDRDHFGRLVLSIRLGTVGRAGGPMKIQWFWVGNVMQQRRS